jgi:hypothetical protein
MTLDNNKLLLLYGFSEEELAFFDNLLRESSIPSYRIIEASMANMKLKDIIDGLKIDTYNKELPNEKIVLFNNFTDAELNDSIKKIRSENSIKPILAIVTPTSINWEFHYLVEHLIEEREQARRFMQQK